VQTLVGTERTSKWGTCGTY